MKKIFAIAMLAFSVGAVAQPRKVVEQKQPQQSEQYKFPKQDRRDDFRGDRLEFRRLDLSWKQEKELKDLLKAKQREVVKLKSSKRDVRQQLKAIDRKYDQRIERLLSKSQLRKWDQYYAYQYSSDARYRV